MGHGLIDGDFEEEDDDEAFYAEKYGHIVGVRADGIGSRLFGARLAAGFVAKRAAAAICDLELTDFINVEHGRRPAEGDMVARAAEAYGVGSRYLLNGAISSPIDALADRLATVQCRFLEFCERTAQEDLDEFENYWPMVQRLQSIRQAAGYDDPMTAAQAHGWNRSIYWGHETGGRPLDVDVLVGYCLSMGARPEYGVLGIEPMLETQAVDWHEHKLVDPACENPGPAAR